MIDSDILENGQMQWQQWKTEAGEIEERLKTRLEAQIAETQAEADARLELEMERVERAQQWERARELVKLRKENLRKCLLNQGDLNNGIEAIYPLLEALDELERLES